MTNDNGTGKTLGKSQNYPEGKGVSCGQANGSLCDCYLDIDAKDHHRRLENIRHSCYTGIMWNILLTIMRLFNECEVTL